MNKARQYDLIVVGAGLTGCTIARLAADSGLRCLVLERRKSIGGNCRDEVKEGINVHLYGPHIFHTSSEEVWRFVNRFASFNDFIYRPLARYDERFYTLPFNLTTFSQIYGHRSRQETEQFLAQLPPSGSTLEQKAISMVGLEMYEILIKGYTEKQWGRSCDLLPASIIERMTLRLDNDDNYFIDRYQGIPVEGYTAMMMRMTADTEVRTSVDFLDNPDYWTKRARKVVYTGPVDELCDYCLGALEYRNLYWSHYLHEVSFYQNTAVINEASAAVPYTRSIEHKHFSRYDLPYTIVSREYPKKWQRGEEAYYPVADKRNLSLYEKYVDLCRNRYPDIILAGRLGCYRYLDMDKAVAEAMKFFNIILKNIRS